MDGQLSVNNVLYACVLVCVGVCVCADALFERCLSTRFSYTCGSYLSHSAVPPDLALFSQSQNSLPFSLTFIIALFWVVYGCRNDKYLNRCLLITITFKKPQNLPKSPAGAALKVPYDARLT